VRKQKRWQDGRVKYHTFNKRVMLYDDTLNFIGDTHWKEGHDLSVGDDVSLDTGVLIQVEDLLVTTQTNLAPLFERDKNKHHQEQAKEDTSKPPLPKLAGRGTGRNENTQHKHRSLSAMLNAGKGAHGKPSLPMQSPFEIRKANQENQFNSGRNAKRQKTNPKIGSIEQMQPQTRANEGLKMDISKLPLGRARSRPGLSNQSSSLRWQIVDIASEADIFLSDVTTPSSPKLEGTAARSLPEVKQKKTAPRIPKPKSPAPPPERSTSPPVSTKSKIRHVDNMLEHVEEVAPRNLTPVTTPTVAKTKQLRLAKTQQRPMLFCQKKPLQPTTQGPPAKPTKEKRPNLYLSLSDMEDEEEQVRTEIFPKPTKRSISEARKTTVELMDEPLSSTGAFDIGQSSSPRQTATKRKPLAAQIGSHVARKDLQNGDAFDSFANVHCDDSAANTITEEMATSAVATKQRKPGKAPVKATVIVEQDGNAIDPYDVRTAKKKRKQIALKAKGKSLSNVIDRLNEKSREIDDEGMGSLAMEERAKALAAAGPHRNQGPWTMEATDLFDWRPPDWEERVKAMATVT
jgi:hypothetical protein